MSAIRDKCCAKCVFSDDTEYENIVFCWVKKDTVTKDECCSCFTDVDTICEDEF